MLKNQKLKILLISLFCLIELILAVLVQTTAGAVNVAVSYSAVILACLFMITSFEKNKTYVFMQIGLICTVLADWFLVVKSPIQQLPAMIFFSGTQICYFLRLYFNHNSQARKRIHLIIRASASVVMMLITAMVLKDKTDALSLVSMFYYANLILNMIVAFSQSKSSLLFPIGLTLFILCDTVIGLDILLASYIKSQEAKEIFYQIFGKFNVAWLFYVPSQALIALSLTMFKNAKKQTLSQ